ncbi:adhesion G protein-coupled receptor B1-like [Actinia tenebrosa]|uniref:Adhesion G protein-coupled receptor B1-like n=1 Tax=Actinia tenebrosa TaxID=6105 RepID=A0A6P8HG11_ACTTE|nr:adhesion G protein-coupled receptor B1-like [Actinia tenebrosa]
MASMCKCCRKNERVHDLIQVREALNVTPQPEQPQEEVAEQYGCLTRFLIYGLLGGSVMIILVVVLSVALTLENSKDLSKQRDELPINKSLEWSEWGVCSRTCGNGTRTRQLDCSTTTGPCNSSILDTQDCNNYVCPTDFSQWGLWSSCSVTCGGGLQERNRTCIVEVCSNARKEIRACNQHHCDFSPWNLWSSCSVSCGGGLQVRNRTCTNQDCSGVRQEKRVCNEQTCDFSQWSPWTSCSVTCGEGSQSRIRICRIQACSGISEENRACTQQPCEFGDWGPWSTCTASCGGGCQSRNRTCIVQQCSGITQENMICNERSCEGNLICSRKTLNICSSYLKTWKVRELNPAYITLDRCTLDDMSDVSELLLLVGRSENIDDYGKYEVVKVNTCAARSCVVPLASPLSKLYNLSSKPCEIIAQGLVKFDNVTLTHWCTLTCHTQSGSLGSILALRATNMIIDSTSQIDVTGKGFIGGIGGGTDGSGGHGGETFRCQRGYIGKGGNGGQDGGGGGGAGDGMHNIHICYLPARRSG